MKSTIAANGFAAMGSDARLKVLRLLVRAGHDGLTTGKVQDKTGIAPSTLAHHLRSLTDAGLITQEKVGRAVISRANYTVLEALAAFILNECCIDSATSAQTPEPEAAHG